jgi:hypothetical protein
MGTSGTVILDDSVNTLPGITSSVPVKLRVRVVGLRPSTSTMQAAIVHVIVQVDGSRSLNKLSQPMAVTPTAFSLYQNYPNPFNPSTTIRYALSEDAHVTLRLYDILGREVATLVDRFVETGYHHVNLDATSLASGVYFYRIEAGTFTNVKKLLLLK